MKIFWRDKLSFLAAPPRLLTPHPLLSIKNAFVASRSRYKIPRTESLIKCPDGPRGRFKGSHGLQQHLQAAHYKGKQCTQTSAASSGRALQR